MRSELPDRDTCSPTSSIGVYGYFLLEMRLLQINVNWSELKLINHLKKKRPLGLHKTFYSLRTHSPVCTLLSEVTPAITPIPVRLKSQTPVQGQQGWGSPVCLAVPSPKDTLAWGPVLSPKSSGPLKGLNLPILWALGVSVCAGLGPSEWGPSSPNNVP